MEVPRPPKGTQVLFQAIEDRMHLLFVTKNQFNGSNHHVFDITPMWKYWMEELHRCDKALAEPGDGGQCVAEPSCIELEKLCAQFIEKKMVTAAESALDAYMKAVNDGPDEQFIEAMRVYQALWCGLQDLKEANAGQN